MSNVFSVSIGDIVPKNQQLVTIDSKSGIVEALKTLSSKNIYSAPVRDNENGTYYGFLDVADIVVFLVTLIEEKQSSDNQEFSSFLESVSKLDLQNAKNIADLSAMNAMVPLRPNDTLSEALKLFASTGTHRIPILKGEEVADLSGVLTQIDVINYLAAHIRDLPPECKKTLKDLDVKPVKVISVEIGARSFDAFQLMTKNRITGVAVVNHDGTLFSNLSLKDIKDVQPHEVLIWMNRSALELIQMIRSKQINVTAPSFACHMHNTLEEVIMKLSVLRVHRLFITDSANKPIGILTLGDIFKLLQK